MSPVHAREANRRLDELVVKSESHLTEKETCELRLYLGAREKARNGGVALWDVIEFNEAYRELRMGIYEKVRNEDERIEEKNKAFDMDEFLEEHRRYGETFFSHGLSHYDDDEDNGGGIGGGPA